MDSRVLYNEDCLLTMSRFADGCIDLTVTSPPYNVDLGNNKFNKDSYDVYDDARDYEEYLNWLERVFTEVYRITADGGRLVINIGDGQNGARPTHAHLITRLCSHGWGYYGTIVWDKSNVSSRTAWGSFASPSCPSFPCPFEYVLVFYKGSRRLRGGGSRVIPKDRFVESAYALWRFAGTSQGQGFGTSWLGDAVSGHPATFPLELPRRCIEMLTWEGSMVYDPFMGSGTTAMASELCGCRWVGSELSPEYCRLAEVRLMEYGLEYPQLGIGVVEIR